MVSVLHLPHVAIPEPSSEGLLRIRESICLLPYSKECHNWKRFQTGDHVYFWCHDWVWSVLSRPMQLLFQNQVQLEHCQTLFLDIQLIKYHSGTEATAIFFKRPSPIAILVERSKNLSPCAFPFKTVHKMAIIGLHYMSDVHTDLRTCGERHRPSMQYGSWSFRIPDIKVHYTTSYVFIVFLNLDRYGS